ncbi:hypothetical protein [Sphingomonas sp. UYP23]
MRGEVVAPAIGAAATVPLAAVAVGGEAVAPGIAARRHRLPIRTPRQRSGWQRSRLHPTILIRQPLAPAPRWMAERQPRCPPLRRSLLSVLKGFVA